MGYIIGVCLFIKDKLYVLVLELELFLYEFFLYE